jgi:hypothetical protein
MKWNEEFVIMDNGRSTESCNKELSVAVVVVVVVVVKGKDIPITDREGP